MTFEIKVLPVKQMSLTLWQEIFELMKTDEKSWPLTRVKNQLKVRFILPWPLIKWV